MNLFSPRLIFDSADYHSDREDTLGPMGGRTAGLMRIQPLRGVNVPSGVEGFPTWRKESRLHRAVSAWNRW